MPVLSKIQLPSGVTYELKDAYARQLLAGGLKFVICWDGNSTPVVANIPAGVKVKYQGTEYTGTKAASTAEPLTFYLVKSATEAGQSDSYDEYAAIGEEGSKYWEKIGDTNINLDDLGALAYKDSVTLSKGNGANVLGEDATFQAQSSEVSFDSGAGSDFVTGYNNDAVAPSFSEGAFTPAALQEGFVTPGQAPSFSEGAFTPAAIQNGFVTPGVAPSFSEGAFDAGSLPSLGNATKSQFAVEGMVAEMGTGDDAETLILSAASKSNAVTEQGTFSAGSLPSKAADTFSAGSPTAIDTTKFSGGSKAADTFSAGSVTAIDTTKFSGGSKAADTFNAGSAATLAKAKALTAAVKGTAAAQSVSVNSKDAKKIALYDDLGVSVS